MTAWQRSASSRFAWAASARTYFGAFSCRDTNLAELYHVFQVVMGWENWHLHSFHLWGKEYGILYAGGTCFADNAARVHLGDFPWRAIRGYEKLKSVS